MIGFWLIFAISVVGCVSTPEPQTATANVIRVTSQEGNNKPYIYGWRLSDETLISLGDVNFAILGIQLYKTETKIFYSLSGTEAAQFVTENRIKMLEDTGRVIELIKVIPLAKIEDIEVGIMNFGPRVLGATELYLHILNENEQVENPNILVARFDGPSSEDRIDSIFSNSRRDGVQQKEYRIVMNWWLPPDQELPGTPSRETELAASSIPATRLPWADLSTDKDVYFEISFLFENLEDKQIAYLAVQLLSDGNAFAAVDKSVIVPTPIYVATLTPTTQPYPKLEAVPQQTTTTPYPAP